MDPHERSSPVVVPEATRMEGELSALVPQGWFRRESVTLLHPRGIANVIASTEPLDRDIDAQRYASVQGELLRSEFPGFREIRVEGMRAFGGLEGFVRRFEWTPPDDAPVTQIQVYAVLEGQGIIATATCPTGEFTATETLLVSILEGLVFSPRNRDGQGGTSVGDGARTQ